jgi:cytochrome b561
MAWRNTEQAYGSAAKWFHWIIALLIITLLVIGLVMTSLKPSPQMFQIFALHKSLGITVLFLAALRLLWRLSGKHVFPLPNHQHWEKFLARLVHGLLYFAMFLMPLSGWIMSSAHGFSVSFFGLFTLPDFVPHSNELSEFAKDVHNISAYTLIGVITLHVAGALKHYVIDHDRTLQRMLPEIGK